MDWYIIISIVYSVCIVANTVGLYLSRSRHKLEISLGNLLILSLLAPVITVIGFIALIGGVIESAWKKIDSIIVIGKN